MNFNPPTESDDFWSLYWEMRLNFLQNLGKKQAILATSRLIRQLAPTIKRPLRLLELGSGEGQIIGALVEGHSQLIDSRASVGVDYLPSSVQTARRDYPSMTFHEGDFTDPALIASLGQFEIVILVNALHEVFSATFSEALGEVDVPAAKQRVEAAFQSAVSCLAPNGRLLLFDGLEPPGDRNQRVRIKFLTPQAAENFRAFAGEYHPFRVTYRTLGSPNIIELPRYLFTRYITKSIFLGKRLWQHERFESYQYYTEAEFRAAFARAGLAIQELRTLTVDEEKWQRTVQILTPGITFPEEHILIIAAPSPSS